VTTSACPAAPARRPRRGRHTAGAAVRALARFAVLALLGGCSTLPSLEGRTESTAIVGGHGTRLFDALAPRAAAHPGLSGIHALTDGRSAFAARIALAEAAEKSLDVQYYIWHDDVSGRLLFDALRRAADRGVRVRLLLDDNNTTGLDPTLAELNRHPNLEVRLFNPFPNRGWRLLGYLTDFGRLNRRMHNKSFTADGVATIVGGRNVGDEYFAAGDGVGFVDLDVVAVGAVVASVAASFDAYWTSASAYPAERILPKAGEAALAQVVDRARATVDSRAARDYADSVRDTRLVQDLLNDTLEFEWCEAALVVDDPSKGLGRARRKDLLMSSLEHVVGPVRGEVQVVSPYFVPARTGMLNFVRLAQSGVDVSILTNSLEATDVLAVHAGYAKRRAPLVQAGVKLYELKKSAVPPIDRSAFALSRPRVLPGSRRPGSARGVSHGASLHAKTFAVDRERLFVGSFNFDPRSAALNTEMGLVMRSPRLATGLAQLFDEAIPAASYRVEFGPGRRLEWHERAPDGTETVHATEPGTTRLQRFAVGALKLLPIDWLL
jgi:putative cardiolipin synthase